MNVYEAVTRRRSIRRFTDKAVPRAILEKCVDAARLTPSAMNLQPCEYIIVDDKELLPKVFATVRSWAGKPWPAEVPVSYQPKAYIVTLINSRLEEEMGGKRNHTVIDVGQANENMILVAMEEGLGSCTLMSFTPRELKPLLGLPDHHDIGLVLALGYPAESPVIETSTDSTKRWTDESGVLHVPKRKLEDILHYNKIT